jgi:hypothetical protein
VTPTRAPIVLFIYNRPAHTARTLDALSANALARESDLIIYADGPKKPEHLPTVREARAVARNAAGFRSVRIVEREENLGLGQSIASGVDELCRSAGRVIVVEDDLLVAPRFLEFLNLALERYSDDPQVMQISGYAFPVPARTGSHFLPIISCWGWATWARAWKHFDPEMTAFDRISGDAAEINRFNLDGAYDYWGMARSQRDRRIDSWGIRWQMSLFARDGLVLFPSEGLVENTGVDSSGTHGAGQSGLQRPLAGMPGGLPPEPVDWRWPCAIGTDQDVFEQVKALLRAQRPSAARATIEKLVRAFVPEQARAALKAVLKSR